MINILGANLFFSLSPSISHLNGDTGVTRLAKRHQVAFIIRAAVFQRNLVVYFRCNNQTTMRKAVLTKRVHFDVSRADLAPRTTITLSAFIRTLIFIVAAVHYLLVFLAVPSVR